MKDSGCSQYLNEAAKALSLIPTQNVLHLAGELYSAWEAKNQVFLCGNGGSAANALHIANDLVCGLEGVASVGIHSLALTGNISQFSCLANDHGYDQVFSRALRTQARSDDLLIALSGSGNSENILSAIRTANDLGLKSFAITGYSGGRASALAHNSIHTPVNDMQISEDIQLIIGHWSIRLLRQMIKDNKPIEAGQAKSPRPAKYASDI